jgi:hypothetical protein
LADDWICLSIIPPTYQRGLHKINLILRFSKL